jgi:hypothetical protein
LCSDSLGELRTRHLKAGPDVVAEDVEPVVEEIAPRGEAAILADLAPATAATGMVESTEL